MGYLFLKRGYGIYPIKLYPIIFSEEELPLFCWKHQHLLTRRTGLSCLLIPGRRVYSTIHSRELLGSRDSNSFLGVLSSKITSPPEIHLVFAFLPCLFSSFTSAFPSRDQISTYSTPPFMFLPQPSCEVGWAKRHL